MLVTYTNDVVMHRFVNMVLKTRSAEFMLIILHKMNIMQYIHGRIHQNEDIFFRSIWCNTPTVYEFIICAML